MLTRLSLLTLLLGAVLPTFAGAPDAPAAGGAGFRARWIDERLAIGVDWSRVALDETRRLTPQGPDNKNVSGNFLGSLWGLDAEQSLLPAPFVEYRVLPAIGLGLSYDRLKAKTLDWGDPEHTFTVGDGDVLLHGAQVYAFGRYANRTRVTPRASLGYARYASAFAVLPGWTGGDPGRAIQVDGTSGWFLGLGAEVRIRPHVALDVAYRRSHIADVAARAYADIIDRPNQHRNGAFPMRGTQLRIGLAYHL